MVAKRYSYASVTRENNFKLVSQHCRYDFRKYYFTATWDRKCKIISFRVYLSFVYLNFME